MGKISKVDSTIIINRIKEFQETQYGHPFTCRTSSCRAELVGHITGQKVVLLCPECGYVQNLPDGVFDTDDWND